MSGGTEAFPNLGQHCSEETCHQLDFLPFKCNACLKVFCLEHRSYKAHLCPKSNVKDRSVIICPVCSASVNKVFGETSESILKKHNDTGACRPGLALTKSKCPVKGCRELLTFSNTYHCKSCRKDTCLKHRYAADHLCAENKNGPFLEALAKRGAADCGTNDGRSRSSKGNGPKEIARRLSSLSFGKAY